MKKKLAKFEVEGRLYEVFGEYELCEIKGSKSKMFPSVEFVTVYAKEIINGEAVDFSPQGHKFNGDRYDAEDMISGLIADMMLGGDTYRVHFLEPELQRVVDFYITDTATQVDEKGIPHHILSTNMELYDLLLVTNVYIYYGHDQEVLMLAIADHGIISDNHFAEVGFWDSVENIKAGEEVLIWGELPEE